MNAPSAPSGPTSPSARPPRIVDRLRRQADQRFVGREAELDMVRQALRQALPPFAVLAVHGPGGIGKTAFAERLRSLAVEAGMDSLRIDARDLDAATPDALLRALAASLGLPQDAHAASGPLLGEVLATWARQPRRLLIIDTFELLAHLEAWLRDRLLAELPEQSVVVLAGRQPPSRHWLNDPVWRGGLRVMGLRNLTPADCERLLTGHGIPPELSEATLKLTYGHPLALTLLADVIQAQGAVPEKLDTDLIRQLTECLISQVPSELHRAALEACACARATTQDLLAEVVDAGHAAELFDWLAGLGFVEAGPQGLFPHDLVRDAVVAELRWRHRSRSLALTRRLRDHHVRRMATAVAAGRSAAALDVLYLQRFSKVMRRFVDFSAVGDAYFDAAREGDLEPIAALARAQLGPEFEGVARHWWGHPAARYWVARDRDQRLVGATFFVDVASVGEEEMGGAPFLVHTARWVAANAPARPGDLVLCSPFIVAEGPMHAPNAAMNTLQMCMVFHWMTMPRLAVFAITADEPAYWAPMMHYIDFHPIDTPPLVMDGRRGRVFLHDWRVTPPERWMNLITARAQELEIGSPQDEPAPVGGPEPIVMLSQSMFERAVKDGLRQIGDLSLLAANPLARSRLVQSKREGDEAPEQTLRRLLHQAVATLGEHPRHVKFQRALELTYLSPVGSQELAAERLGLAFSTYRYQLATGIERAAAWLWRQEMAV